MQAVKRDLPEEARSETLPLEPPKVKKNWSAEEVKANPHEEEKVSASEEKKKMEEKPVPLQQENMSGAKAQSEEKAQVNQENESYPREELKNGIDGVLL